MLLRSRLNAVPMYDREDFTPMFNSDCAQPQEFSPRSARPRSRSRLASRDGGRPGKGSVKDLVYTLEEQVKSLKKDIEKADDGRKGQKDEIKFMMTEMRREMEEEFAADRKAMRQEIQSARDEIESLNTQLRVQKGHIVALQEQCKAIHGRVNDMDQDVQELITEVVGE